MRLSTIKPVNPATVRVISSAITGLALGLLTKSLADIIAARIAAWTNKPSEMLWKTVTPTSRPDYSIASSTESTGLHVLYRDNIVTPHGSIICTVYKGRPYRMEVKLPNGGIAPSGYPFLSDQLRSMFYEETMTALVATYDRDTFTIEIGRYDDTTNFAPFRRTLAQLRAAYKAHPATV